MPVKAGLELLILVFGALVAAAAVEGGGVPARVLTLERAFPANETVELEVLKARDRARHARILQGVVDFTVLGTSDPYLAG